MTFNNFLDRKSYTDLDSFQGFETHFNLRDSLFVLRLLWQKKYKEMESVTTPVLVKQFYGQSYLSRLKVNVYV